MFVIVNLTTDKFWDSATRTFNAELSGQFKTYSTQRAADAAATRILRNGTAAFVAVQAWAPRFGTCNWSLG